MIIPNRFIKISIVRSPKVTKINSAVTFAIDHVKVVAIGP
jgi:hypothetical protein